MTCSFLHIRVDTHESLDMPKVSPIEQASIVADDPRSGWYYVEVSDPDLQDAMPTRMWCLYKDDKYYEESRSSTR